MIRSIVAAALCLPLLAFAQAPKKSADQVWNDLYSKREGKEHQFNKFLAETVIPSHSKSRSAVAPGANRANDITRAPPIAMSAMSTGASPRRAGRTGWS